MTLKYTTLREVSEQLDRFRRQGFIKLESYAIDRDDEETLKGFKDIVLKYHRRPDMEVQVLELEGSQELWVKNRYF